MSFRPEEIERYARHLVLREIGGPGQQRLKAARVLIIGAGGLGAPAALYLAAAGVGRLGVADPDHVALSNLQRQILYSTDEVGRLKVDAARARLLDLNPEIDVRAHAVAVAYESCRELLEDYDLVLDGCDAFETRFAVNRAALSAGKPLIMGALGRWTGQAARFEGRPCYRCLVPELPPDADTCAAVGVVGALGGVIGSIMALEAVKTLVGREDGLRGRLFVFDGLALESRTIVIAPDPACPDCGADRRADL